MYRIHKRHALRSPLEDEPKNTNIESFLNFEINAVHARTSILGFVQILRAQGDGFAKPGDSIDLGVQDEDNGPGLQEDGQMVFNRPENATKEIWEHNDGLEMLPDPIKAPGLQSQWQDKVTNIAQTGFMPSRQGPDPTATFRFEQGQLPQEQGSQVDLSNSPEQYEANQIDNAQQPLDVCHPFFDPTMLDLFPDGEMPDLYRFESLPANLFDLELGAWTPSPTAPSGSQALF